jgi:rhodanese-related sulfurtransferase
MTPSEAAAAIAAGCAVVDTRPLEPFAAAHLPGAIALEFNLADLQERAELVLPNGLRVVVHAEPESSVAPSVGLLGDAGLDVVGHVEGGLAAWRASGRPVQTLTCVDVAELQTDRERYLVLDVRERYEFAAGHVPGARCLPSGQIWANAEPDLGAGRLVAVFCSGHGRSTFAASVLNSRGSRAVVVTGGMYEWVRGGYPVEKGA